LKILSFFSGIQSFTYLSHPVHLFSHSVHILMSPILVSFKSFNIISFSFYIKSLNYILRHSLTLKYLCCVPRNRVPKKGSKISQKRSARQAVRWEGPKGHLETTHQIDRPIKQMSAEQPNEAMLPTNPLVEQPSEARLPTNLITEQPSEAGSPTNPMRWGHRPTSLSSNPARRHPGRVDLVLPNYVDMTGHH
jgi:hypothetical protein